MYKFTYVNEDVENANPAEIDFVLTDAANANQMTEGFCRLAIASTFQPQSLYNVFKEIVENYDENDFMNYFLDTNYN